MGGWCGSTVICYMVPVGAGNGAPGGWERLKGSLHAYGDILAWSRPGVVGFRSITGVEALAFGMSIPGYPVFMDGLYRSRLVDALGRSRIGTMGVVSGDGIPGPTLAALRGLTGCVCSTGSVLELAMLPETLRLALRGAGKAMDGCSLVVSGVGKGILTQSVPRVLAPFIGELYVIGRDTGALDRLCEVVLHETGVAARVIDEGSTIPIDAVLRVEHGIGGLELAVTIPDNPAPYLETINGKGNPGITGGSFHHPEHTERIAGLFGLDPGVRGLPLRWFEPLLLEWEPSMRELFRSGGRTMVLLSGMRDAAARNGFTVTGCIA